MSSSKKPELTPKEKYKSIFEDWDDERAERAIKRIASVTEDEFKTLFTSKESMVDYLVAHHTAKDVDDAAWPDDGEPKLTDAQLAGVKAEKALLQERKDNVTKAKGDLVAAEADPELGLSGEDINNALAGLGDLTGDLGDDDSEESTC